MHAWEGDSRLADADTRRCCWQLREVAVAEARVLNCELGAGLSLVFYIFRCLPLHFATPRTPPSPPSAHGPLPRSLGQRLQRYQYTTMAFSAADLQKVRLPPTPALICPATPGARGRTRSLPRPRARPCSCRQEGPIRARASRHVL